MIIGRSPIDYRAEMKTIDLEPGEYEVIDLGPPIDPEEYRRERLIRPLIRADEAIREMRITFTKFSEAMRRLYSFNFPYFSEPEPRERHHMQFIERHIRKVRKPK